MIEEIIEAPHIPVEFALRLPNGRRLAGKRWGPVTTPTSNKILALHGWLDNASTWDGVAPELAKKGMVIIALDFLGHGKSEHQVDMDYSLHSHVLTIIAAAKVIGWEKFSLIGHSMGASVATFVAATIPEQVITLSLVEGFGEWPFPMNALKLLQASVESRNKQFFDRQPKVYPDIKSAIRKLRENNSSLAAESASKIVLRSLVKVQDGFSFSHDPRGVARTGFKFGEKETRDFIAGIRCPVILFWTKKTLEMYSTIKFNNNLSIQDVYQQRLEILNPNITRNIVLEEGSHHVHLDRPELVLNHLYKFYDTYLQPVAAKL